MKEYPGISSQHIASARLYANRSDMVLALKGRLRPNPVVCEVGVALGDFSEFLINALQPTEFIAMDLFGLDQLDTLWGTSTREIFRGKSHAQFYRDRFATENVRVIEGDSVAALSSLPEHSVDLIYIDGDHSYEGVKADTTQAVRKVTEDGLLLFNDYVLYDHVQKGEFGVIQAVNELVSQSDWRIVGFALQHAMFCDIALQRSEAAVR